MVIYQYVYIKFLINIFFWVVIIFIPVIQIFEYDFRIFKLIRLYGYSKSKNINKRIIYEGIQNCRDSGI